MIIRASSLVKILAFSAAMSATLRLVLGLLGLQIGNVLS